MPRVSRLQTKETDGARDGYPPRTGAGVALKLRLLDALTCERSSRASADGLSNRLETPHSPGKELEHFLVHVQGLTADAAKTEAARRSFKVGETSIA